MTASRTDLPAAFLERMERLLGPELDAFLAAVAAPALGLRVNTLRLAPEELRALSPFGLAPLPFPEEGFIVDGGERPGRHPHHAAGLYYLQDPGAMTVGALVDPLPGERVLDLAAAPGGKATHLAARMRGSGILVANDVHAGRARELAGNLERCGVTEAVVTNETAERIATHFGAWFDRVLLDAPCSGESMFHKSDAAREEWSEAAVSGCARRQEGLLEEAARCVRPGGLLVYSTCTFSPEENESVIARFLDARLDFTVERLATVPGGERGRPEWVDSRRVAEVERTTRLWPHRVPGAGHFVAGLRRGDGAESDPGAFRGSPLPKPAREAMDALVETVARDPERVAGRWWARGAEIFRVPDAAPDLGRLRVERPGWWLGSLAKGRAEPAHALAMALHVGEAVRSVTLTADRAEALAYLRGETFTAPGEPGWTLVTVDGFPLGWGKRTGTTVKNHRPKGLRFR